MAVKDSGSPLALGGSRKKGVEATQTASGIDITGTDICEEFGHTGSDQTVNGVNIGLSAYHKGSGGLVPDTSTNSSVANSTTAQKRFNHYYGSQNTFFQSSWSFDTLTGGVGNWNFEQSVTQSFGNPTASAAITFTKLTTGNNANSIRVTYTSGDSQNGFDEYSDYLEFSPDLANRPWYVRYNYVNNSTDASVSGDANPSNSSCHAHYLYTDGPRPSDDGYSPGTWLTVGSNNVIGLHWAARANQSPQCQQQATVTASFPSAQGTNDTNHAYPFQVAILLPGASYGSGPGGSSTPNTSSFVISNSGSVRGTGVLFASRGLYTPPTQPGQQ